MHFQYMLKSKIHRATVTDGDIDYEGSIAIDEDLMDAAKLIENEFVHIWDATNGSRLKTYVIKGRRGTGEMVINGAAAHLVKKGDIIIVSSMVFMPHEDAVLHKPVKVFVDTTNKIKYIT